MKNISIGLCIGLLLVGWPLAAMATFAVDGGINDDDGVVNGVVTIATAKAVPLTTALYDQTASDFHIVAGGHLALESDASFTTCWIHFSNLTIDDGGYITSNGQGYPSDEGLGTPPPEAVAYSGSGAGHGGFGGRGADAVGSGISYDFPYAPEMYGSGGGSATSAQPIGGRGGGIVLLNIQGQFTMNGHISADGENGVAFGEYAGGGGSGGAIQILAGIYAGTTGTFSATGGDGGVAVVGQGGGGGGGMIVIHCGENNSSFLGYPGTYSVDGGSGGSLAEDGFEGLFVKSVDGYVSTQETSWGKIKSLYK